MRRFSLLLPALICSVPAAAGTILFSDLGAGYDPNSYWAEYGSASYYGAGFYNAHAAMFSAAGTGSEMVSQIDLAVANTVGFPPGIAGLNTFYASIWSGLPGFGGSQVPGAYWSLSTNIPSGTCCALVSITSISGVTLTGGQQY